MVQGGTTIDYAFWHGMIDLRTYRSLHEKWDQCVAGKIKDSSIEPFHPYTTPDECGIVKAVMAASGSKQMYEVTTYDTYPGMVSLVLLLEVVFAKKYLLNCNDFIGRCRWYSSQVFQRS
jgi:hypothetical protein